MTTVVRTLFERFISARQEERVRAWAADNAYSLVFVSLVCVITWTLIIIDILVGVRG